MARVAKHLHGWRWIAVLSMTVVLSACTSPKLDVRRLNLLVSEAIIITSKEPQRLLIRSAVANNNHDNASCNQAVGKSLAYGESTTVFFTGCGEVIEFTIYTDGGTWSGKYEK